jgi:rhamnosyltransferase
VSREPIVVERNRVGIVVVFYHPDASSIERATHFAEHGVCVVVDNTEGDTDSTARSLGPNVVYLPNGRNLGIATAINQGVDHLNRMACRYAILFDQDSEPADELLHGLPQLLEQASANGRRVALVGPAYEDARLGGVAPFVRFAFPALKRVSPDGAEPVGVDFLITSGSCLNLAAWKDIGPMDDGLFIDFVDLEWCVRARRAGYDVLGAPSLRLRHSLGGEPVSVLGRAYPSHSPLRHYYLFRNATALLRRAYVPWTWKWTEAVKFPVRLVIYVGWLTPRLEHLRMAMLGMWHGLTGRMGPYRKD